MKVTMEMENGELLQCCVCEEIFNGTAILIIDEGAVEEVYCVPCDIQSSTQTANQEEN